MAVKPSVPEIITVNSEALQAQIRDLLPSQNGFGSELQASNVIFPIIDLTAAAEGSGLGTSLQTAIAFGSQTAFSVTNTTTTILNTTGFFRIFGVASIRGAVNGSIVISMSDGFSSKTIWTMAGDSQSNLEVDFVVFLRAGDSVDVSVSTNTMFFIGSTRQVATGDGELVQPNGFPL